jgi:uncharacterized membrane protein
MFSSFMGALMIDFVQPQCLGNMGLTVGLIVGALGFNAILGVCFLCLVLYRHFRRDYLTFERVVLGRCIVLTITSSNKLIFWFAYVIDTISLVMFVVELAMLPRAKANCPSGFLAFYNLTIVLQSITLIRLFLLWVHFRRGKPFYRWLKRRFTFL